MKIFDFFKIQLITINNYYNNITTTTNTQHILYWYNNYIYIYHEIYFNNMLIMHAYNLPYGKLKLYNLIPNIAPVNNCYFIIRTILHPHPYATYV